MESRWSKLSSDRSIGFLRSAQVVKGCQLCSQPFAKQCGQRCEGFGMRPSGYRQGLVTILAIAAGQGVLYWELFPLVFLGMGEGVSIVDNAEIPVCLIPFVNSVDDFGDSCGIEYFSGESLLSWGEWLLWVNEEFFKAQWEWYGWKKECQWQVDSPQWPICWVEFSLDIYSVKWVFIPMFFDEHMNMLEGQDNFGVSALTIPPPLNNTLVYLYWWGNGLVQWHCWRVSSRAIQNQWLWPSQCLQCHWGIFIQG